jgi:hypothetical protein
MTKAFRHSAGFGKRVEHWIVGRMLKDQPGKVLPNFSQRLLDDIL